MRLLAIAVLAWLTISPLCVAQKAFEDEEHGFSIRAPDKWTQVPTSPTEKLIVAQWRGKRQEQAKKTSAGNSIKVHTPDLQVLYLDRALTAKSANAAKQFDYLQLLKARIGKDLEVVDSKPGTMGKAKTTTYQLREPWDETSLRRCATVVEADNAVYVVEMSCLDDTFSSHQAEFTGTLRSFHLIESKKPAATESPDPAKAKAPGKPIEEDPDAQAKFLDEQIKKAQSAGWKHAYSPTRRYLFLYNAEEAFVRELMWRIEAIRDHYERIYPADKKITAVSIVRVCKNIDDYHAYGGPPNTGGYWSDGNRELVFYDNKDQDRKYGYTVLCHEGFHQYIYYFYDKLAPHSWYNEGNGDYFAGAVLQQAGQSGKVVSIDMVLERRSAIKEAIQKGTFVPLKDLFQFTQRQYYERTEIQGQPKVEICYAEGWSVVYFLREGAKKVAMDPKWTSILSTYLTALQDVSAQVRKGRPTASVDSDDVRAKAFAAAFKDWTDQDWKKLEDAWKGYPW